MTSTFGSLTKSEVNDDPGIGGYPRNCHSTWRFWRLRLWQTSLPFLWKMKSLLQQSRASGRGHHDPLDW